MNMKKRNDGYMTLDEIREEKLEVLTKIHKQKDSISNIWNDIFAPCEATSKTGHIFNLVDNSIAIYDGTMLGYKLIQRLRSFFRRNKR
jgi:hypothetical protein